MKNQLIVVTMVSVALGSTLFSQDSSQQNLQTCLSGQYPALCNHNELTPDQLSQVRAAETRENLRVCLTGKYPALCGHARLTADQALSVKEAEMRENLIICSTGRYPALCNHSLLTSGQGKAVNAAEAQAAQATTTQPPPDPSIHSVPHEVGRTPTCKSGLSIESVEGDGKVIKLDDGSIWEVDDVDTIDSALWLVADEVVVCKGKIINTDEDESVEATPIHAKVSATGTPIARSSSYAIEASANDETFVINGEVFKAKTYCFNFDKGDRVQFIEGSAFGACASAKLLNLRTTKMCDVWCGD